jgi:hypothetical protein
MHIGLIIDQSAHTMDGLLLHGRDGDQAIEAFISRHVLDWVEPCEPPGRRKSLFRAEYNALGQRNVAAI